MVEIAFDKHPYQLDVYRAAPNELLEDCYLGISRMNFLLYGDEGATSVIVP